MGVGPEERARLRDLVGRLGFGNGITEPMADNDTIVEWFEEQAREAAEWRESQRWRDVCVFGKGHSETDDCHECDPALRLQAAEAKVERAEVLAAEWEAMGSATVHETARELGAALRAALDGEADQ